MTPRCGGKLPAQLLARLPVLSHCCRDTKPRNCCGFWGEGMWLVGPAMVPGQWSLQSLSLQGLPILQQSRVRGSAGGSQQSFLSPFFLPLSSAPLWGLHGPWEHMGSVAQKLHTTQSSALLAFTGIIGEKTIIFPLLQQMPKAKNSFIKLLLY